MILVVWNEIPLTAWCVSCVSVTYEWVSCVPWLALDCFTVSGLPLSRRRDNALYLTSQPLALGLVKAGQKWYCCSTNLCLVFRVGTRKCRPVIQVSSDLLFLFWESESKVDGHLISQWRSFCHQLLSLSCLDNHRSMWSI